MRSLFASYHNLCMLPTAFVGILHRVYADNHLPSVECSLSSLGDDVVARIMIVIYFVRRVTGNGTLCPVRVHRLMKPSHETGSRNQPTWLGTGPLH